MKTFSLRFDIPGEVWEQFLKISGDQNVSRSVLAREAILHYMEKLGGNCIECRESDQSKRCYCLINHPWIGGVKRRKSEAVD